MDPKCLKRMKLSKKVIWEFTVPFPLAVHVRRWVEWRSCSNTFMALNIKVSYLERKRHQYLDSVFQWTELQPKNFVCVCVRQRERDRQNDFHIQFSWRLFIVSITKSRKDRYINILTNICLHVESKIKNQLLEIELIDGCWAGFRERKCNKGVKGHKLLVRRWISSEN